MSEDKQDGALAGPGEILLASSTNPEGTPTHPDGSPTLSKPSQKSRKIHVSWKLLFGALVAFAVSALLLIGVDWTEEWIRKSAEARAKYQRRVAAIDAWATQYRLQQLMATQAAPSSTGTAQATAIKAAEDAIEAEIKDAKDRLGVSEPKAEHVIAAKLSPFLEIVLSILEKVAAALVVLALLLALTSLVALIPWVRKRIDALAEKVFEAPETPETKKVGIAPPVPVPPIGATAAPMMMSASIAGATAAIALGAIIITIPQQHVTATVTQQPAAATLAIDPLDIQVPSPGPIRVPITSTSSNGLSTRIDGLTFNFPQIPIDRTALDQFTTAMTSYAAALHQQDADRKRIDDLVKQAIELEKTNTELATELAVKPTEEKVTALEADVKKLKLTDEAVRESLNLLAKSTERQSAGTAIRAFEDLYQINRENDKLSTQLLHPSRKERNCATYRKVVEAADVTAPECIDKGWTDLWYFLTRQHRDSGGASGADSTRTILGPKD